jgi:hypothetical protein
MLSEAGLKGGFHFMLVYRVYMSSRLRLNAAASKGDFHFMLVYRVYMSSRF